MSSSLATAFLAARPQGSDGADSADGASIAQAELEPLLVAITLKARAEHPGAQLDDARFVRHLAERADATIPVDEALGALKTTDLFLACAAALGDRGAISLLESTCIRTAQGALGKRAMSPDIIEEANQNVRERLLVGAGSPKLFEYDGKGDLKSWVRVVVVREAIYLSKRGKREEPLAMDLLTLPSADDNPEIAYFKARYRAEYKEAFAAAVDELTARERSLLRQQIVLRMTVDEIGAVYQVHRATAARWVQSARDELLSKARLQLAIRLNLSRAEIEHIVRMIESQLEVSMSRLLKATSE